MHPEGASGFPNSADTPSPQAARPGPESFPRRRHVWLVRLAFGALIVLGLPLVAEGILRLGDWGYPTSFCLTQRTGRAYTDNDKFLWPFYSRNTRFRPTPFSVARAKAPGTVRIVVLGESAAAGTPDPAYSFGRILERMLRDRYPQRQIELINAAMRGANSHVAVAAARDALQLEPDLFVVYLGNGECLGPFAPGQQSGWLTGHPKLLSALERVRRTRLGELADSFLPLLASDIPGPGRRGDAFYKGFRVSADDPKRREVVSRFKANLRQLCRIARRGKAGVVLTRVPVNQTDCPPFASTHRDGLTASQQAAWETAFNEGKRCQESGKNQAALDHYTAAAALDDHFAELHFRIAQCWEALGNAGNARAAFLRARDGDALQLRADSVLNQAVAECARELPSVSLVDAERALNEPEPPALDARRGGFFYDHIHLTFDGAYALAGALLPSIEQALAAKLGPSAKPGGVVLSREQCAEQLAFTAVNEAQIMASIARSTGQAPFTGQFDHQERHSKLQKKLRAQFEALTPPGLQQATKTYRAAIELFPNDWQLRYNFGRLLLVSRDNTGCIEQFKAARRLLPHSMFVRLGLSGALSSAGRFDEALWQLNEALALDPQSREARTTIALIEAQRRKAATF